MLLPILSTVVTRISLLVHALPPRPHPYETARVSLDAVFDDDVRVCIAFWHKLTAETMPDALNIAVGRAYVA